MRLAMFATKTYDRQHFDAANAAFAHEIVYFAPRLDAATAALTRGFDAVCVFVNDLLDTAVLEQLSDHGIRLVALRCAGYNNVDLAAAARLGIRVVRVPAYSPHAVAEFTIALMLAVDRKIHRAWARVRENNFALDELVGHNLFGRTAGVVGTGEIGRLVARTLRLGFGCEVLASDPMPNDELLAASIRYVEPQVLLAESDIVSLHCPLTPETHHLINAHTLARAREGLLIINTGRGALIDTQALIEALKSKKLSGVALDVYEQEEALFFEDLSSEVIQDDVFQRLLTFPNVLITGIKHF